MKYCATPQYVFYFNATKDEVYMNISKYISSDKTKLYLK